MLAQRAKDRAAIGLHRRHLLEVSGRKAAAEIDHGKIDPALRAGTKNRRCRFEGIVPGLDATLLRTHMERDAAGIEPALTSVVEHLGRHLRVATEFPRERQLRPA